jgi:hypothetical protein
MFTKAAVGAIVALTTLVPMECAQRAGDRSCPQHEATLETFAPEAGWSVARMSRIMWRESRCDPTAWNARGHASGLLQVTPISYPYLREALGEWVDRWTLQDPEQNVRASAALFDYWAKAGKDGYRPWRL